MLEPTPHVRARLDRIQIDSHRDTTMIEFEGQSYFDDRVFVLEVVPTIVEGKGARWSVITRRNVPGFPPRSTYDFATRIEAIEYLDDVEPWTPLISLDGRSSEPVPTLLEYRAWLESNGLSVSNIWPDRAVEGQVFELYAGDRLYELIEAKNWEALAWSHNRSSINTSPTARDAWDWRVGGFTTPFLISLRIEKLSESGAMPWAVITFDRPYELMGHFLETRGTQQDMLGGCHTTRDLHPIHISLVFVLRRAALERAASESRLYAGAWELLREKTEDRVWLCLPPPLEERWTMDMEAKDGPTRLRERARIDPIR